MQGALDGGLDIPHNQKRFVGYDPDAKEYDADTMRKYIFGGHVADYMAEMEEEEPEKFQAHFKNYIDNDIEADEEVLEELYAGVRTPLAWLQTSWPCMQESITNCHACLIDAVFAGAREDPRESSSPKEGPCCPSQEGHNMARQASQADVRPAQAGPEGSPGAAYGGCLDHGLLYLTVIRGLLHLWLQGQRAPTAMSTV